MSDINPETDARTLRSGKSLNPINDTDNSHDNIISDANAHPISPRITTSDTTIHPINSAFPCVDSRTLLSFIPRPTPKFSEASRQAAEERCRDKLERDFDDEELELEMRALELDRKRLALRRQQVSASLVGDMERNVMFDIDSIKKPGSHCQPEQTEDLLKATSSVSTGRQTPILERTYPPVTRYPKSSADGLPRIEIDKFDGTALHFWTFRRTFQLSVADKLSDENQKLMYLLHYCTGDAKESIRHCVFLPPDEGYRKAMSILESQYGRPDDISECFLRELLNGPSISNNDLKALRDLVRQMNNCEIALSQMNYTADLDCSTNMKRIVARLPYVLQLKWAEVADDFLDHGEKPRFRHLISFLEKRLSIMRNCYGQVAGSSRRQATTREVERHRVNATNTQELRCQACLEVHELASCAKFKEMSPPERFRLAMDSKSCFNCLKRNHRAQNCRSDSICLLNGCVQRHHPLLHPSLKTQAGINTTSANSKRTFLAFVPVRLCGPSGSREVYAFLDSGSDTTLISTEVAADLGLNGDTLPLEVRSINGISTTTSTAVSFSIESLDGDHNLMVDKAFTIAKLPISCARVPSEEEMRAWSHLRDIQLPRIANLKVQLLLGADVCEAQWTIDKRTGSKGQPFAFKTIFGWVVLGPSMGNNGIAHVNSTESEILRIFESDFKDYSDSVGKDLSREDKQALITAQKSVKLIDGHYYLRLPWKLDWRLTPPTRETAERRLQALRGRLRKNEELRKRYDEILTTYVNKGYVRRVRDETSCPRRFVPHHPVFNPRKPNKVRIVFDFAAKTKGITINDCLLSGPDVTNDLTGVLLRFRLYPVALAADIEEMFLQVRLFEDDRPALSFLWYSDGQLDKTPDVYELNVHPFGATSSPFNASFALRQTAVDHAHEFDTLTINAVNDNFYVDDCLVSVRSVEQAVRLVEQLRQITSLGGFRLHKWVSNIAETLNSTPSEERAASAVNLDPTASFIPKTLGLYWCVQSDCFEFKVNLPDRPVTKRGILSCAASLYDPLGYIAPLSMKPKMLVQELCRNKSGWDEPVDACIATAWETWKRNIQLVETLVIPRCILPAEFDSANLTLHLFSDASEIGYGSAAYLRCEDHCQGIHCSFLMGKSRVAPLKPVTIPRLELQAAVMAVKLMLHVMKELKLKFDRVFLWTDSTIVLHYLSNTRTRFKTFVANRISYIQAHTESEQWRFVPTDLNPADIASRGLNSRKIDQLYNWLTGPSFLKLSIDSWPKAPSSPQDMQPLLPEEKKKVSVFHIRTRSDTVDKLLSYFSSWTKLRRAVAWFTRYTNFLKSSSSRCTRKDIVYGPLSLEEVTNAESSLLRYVQASCFTEASNQSTVSPNSKLSSLCPILINGLLCVGGRLRNSELPLHSKHPIILPSNHPVTTTIVQFYHVIEGHMGVSHVVSATRQKFWIIRCAAVVKRVVRMCMGCRARSAIASQQKMAELPPARVLPEFPFAATGIDYFGPFCIREGRKTLKRYGCLFSCLKTRAVHIEVSHTLSTDSFLMALARFINRRGCPAEIYSDQGTNFVGAEQELRNCRKIFRDEMLNKSVVDQNINWRFKPPYSSHRGGVWERIIRSIRRILSAVSREQVLTQESLTTYLTDVERILNDRPLVPVLDDPDSLNVLTPNHLLRLRDSPFTPVAYVDLRDRYSRYWKQANLMTETFWRRWLKEYLSTLQRRTKWVTEGRSFQPGDYVLIIEANQHRGCWPKGVVTEAIKGKDGLVRDLHIKTANGVIHRDVRKICLLEGTEERLAD